MRELTLISAMSTNFDNRKDIYNGNISRYPRTERDFDVRSEYSERPTIRLNGAYYKSRLDINERLQCERGKGRTAEKSQVPSEEFEASNEDEKARMIFILENKLSTIEAICIKAYHDGNIVPNVRHQILEVIKNRPESNRKFSDNLLEKNSVRSRASSVASKARSYRSIRSHKSMKSYRSMKSDYKSIYRRRHPSDSDESGESDDFDIRVSRPPTEHYFADSDRDLPRKSQNLDNKHINRSSTKAIQNVFRKPLLEGIKVLPRRGTSLEVNCQNEQFNNVVVAKKSSKTPQKRLSSGKKKTDKIDTNENIKKLQTASPVVLNCSNKEMDVTQNSKKHLSNAKSLLQIQGQPDDNANNSQTIFEVNLNNSDISQPSFMKRKLFSQSVELLENDPARAIPSPAPQTKMINVYNKNNDSDKLKKSLSGNIKLKDSVKPLNADTENAMKTPNDIRLPVNGQCQNTSKANVTYIGRPRHESTLIPVIFCKTSANPVKQNQKDQSYLNSDSQETNATVIHKDNENKAFNDDIPNIPKSSKWLTDGSEDETGDDEIKQVLNGIGNTDTQTYNQDVRRSVRKNKRPPKLWIDESDHYESCLDNKEKQTPASAAKPAPKKRRTQSISMDVSNLKAMRNNQVDENEKDTRPNLGKVLSANNVISNDLHINPTAIQGRKSLYNNKRLKEIFDSSREYTHTPRRSPRLSCKNKYFQARLNNPKIEDMKVVTVRSRAQFQNVQSDTEVSNRVESEQNIKQTNEESASHKMIPNLKQKNSMQLTNNDIRKGTITKNSARGSKITLSPIPHIKNVETNSKRVHSKSEYDANAMLETKSIAQSKSPIKSVTDIRDVLKTVDLVISDHIRGSKRGGSSYMGVDVLSDDDEYVSPVRNNFTNNDNKRSALERIENHISSRSEYEATKARSMALFDKTSIGQLNYTNQKQNVGLISGLFQTSKMRVMPKSKIDRTLNGESQYRFIGGSSYKSGKSAKFGHCFF